MNGSKTSVNGRLTTHSTIVGALRGEKPPPPLLLLGGAAGAAARKAELGILVLIELLIAFIFADVFNIAFVKVLPAVGNCP